MNDKSSDDERRVPPHSTVAGESASAGAAAAGGDGERANFEAMYRSLVEALPAIVYLVEPRPPFATVYVSPSIASLGYAQEEWFACPDLWITLIHDEDRARVLAETSEAMRNDRDLEYEYRVRARDGSIRWLHDSGRLVRNAAGEAIYWQGVMIDITKRVSAEQVLRESEAKYRALVEQASDSIVIFDKAGRILEVNTQTCETVGFACDELLEMNITELFAEDDLASAPIRWDELLKGNTLLSERRVRARDGNFIDMEVNAKLLPDGRLQAIVRDLTARKRADETLRLLESAVRQTGDGVLITDARLDPPGPSIVFSNPAFTEMSGYTAEELRDLTPRILQGAATDRRVLDHLRRALELGEEFGGETVNYRKDNSPYVVQWNISPIRDPKGEITHYVSIQQDVTQQNESERRLRESEERLRAQFEELPIPTYLWRAEPQDGVRGASGDEGDSVHDDFARTDFTLLDNNKAASALTHNRAGELKGRRASEVYAQRPDILADFRRCLSTGQTVRREMVYEFASSGETKDLAVTYVHVPPDIVMAHLEDLTERRAAEQTLRESEERLRLGQRLEAVGMLAGGVAHDFNNLLTVINGYSSLLLRSLDPHDPAHARVSQIVKAGDRAASLTRQLLAFSRKQILQPRVFDLNHTIADMEIMLRRLIGEDVDLLVVLDPALGHVKADPGQVEQILMNLAVNARDAMPQGGRLTIETANVFLDAEYAGTHVAVAPGHYCLLAVSDTGAGMDAATRERIFEPFFTTKPVGEGTGLGLATVYGIVKQSGGNIWVYSEPGQGTTFKVYLPRVDEVGTEAGIEGEVAATPARVSETVLVVEDEELVRGMARLILEDSGYVVLDARDGEEALDIARRHAGRIDLLLTDVVMPKMSGREVAEAFTLLHPEAGVLFMSGYTNNAIVHHGVLDGDVELIEKPFSPAKLAGRVREILDLNRKRE